MADDDYGTEIPLDIPEAEKQLDAAESGDKPPPDSTTTETPPTAGGDESTATGDMHDDSEYTKQLQNQYETDIKRSEAHAHDQQQYIDYFQKQMANNPQPPQMQQLQQIPPAGQDQKAQVTQRVLQVLAIAAVAFSLFGRRRNGYAQGALMGGVGALINGFVQGQHEQQKEASSKWHGLNESIIKENQMRQQEYKDIMENKRLTLGEQMKLMEMKGKFYESNRMETNAQKQDLAAIHKHVYQQMEQWNKTHMANAVMSKADKANWAALVLEKSDGKADIYTPEGLKWAYKNYPPSQYLNEKKTARKVDETGKASGGFSGKQEERVPETDLDRRMDEKFGKIRPQASPSPSPSSDDEPYVPDQAHDEKSVLGGVAPRNSKPWLKKPSVFDKKDFAPSASNPNVSDTYDDEGTGL
jgi:hypothetical protein